jgi:hypothetical protein
MAARRRGYGIQRDPLGSEKLAVNGRVDWLIVLGEVYYWSQDYPNGELAKLVDGSLNADTQLRKRADWEAISGGCQLIQK